MATGVCFSRKTGLALCAAGVLGCGSLTAPETSERLEFESAIAAAAPDAPPADAAGWIQTPLTRDDLDAPSYDSGLHVRGVTNFEFERTVHPLGPSGVLASGDPLSVITTHWSTVAPISGKADLRVDFTFNRGPATFDEWVAIGLWGSRVDVRRFSTLVVSLESDRPRMVRVKLQSTAYDELFGGIPQDFSVERSVWPQARAISIDLRDFFYPWWARGSWTDGKGFAGNDAEALDRVLEGFMGLVFEPDPTIDPDGELTAPIEHGYLRIDNIYFR